MRTQTKQKVQLSMSPSPSPLVFENTSSPLRPVRGGSFAPKARPPPSNRPLPQHFARRRAPRGRRAEEVGELLVLTDWAAVEPLVQLLPLEAVDLEEGLGRHGAVKVLRPLAQRDGRALHGGPPQDGAERVGPLEGLDVGV